MGSSGRLWLVVAAIVLVAGACGDDGDSLVGTPPAVTFDGSSWVVESGRFDDEAITPIDGQIPTFTVDGDRASGSTGCNAYEAAFSLTAGGVLALTGFSVTEIGCEPDVMEVEAQMLAVLGAVDRFELDGDQLTLTGGDGAASLVMTAWSAPPAAPLDEATWRLTGIERGDVASSVIAGTRPFLVFDLAADAVRGSGGCNDFGAELVIDDQLMTMSERVSTELVCDEAVMAQEADVFETLDAVTGWRIDGETLRLETSGGMALTFVAELTGALPEEAAAAWVAALAAGDIVEAELLTSPLSLTYVDERGGLEVFATELAEGWGAWDRVNDRRSWFVTGRFGDGSQATVVVFVGRVDQEGTREDKAVSLLMTGSDGRFLAHPFATAERIGFVVPREDFLDRVAPDVAFELATPEGFDVLLFLDEGGPLPLEATTTTDGIRVTGTSDPPPQPGKHVLTVIYRTSTGEFGSQAILFATYP